MAKFEKSEYYCHNNLIYRIVAFCQFFPVVVAGRSPRISGRRESLKTIVVSDPPADAGGGIEATCAERAGALLPVIGEVE
ncbi:MAG: hypothetical protein J0I23_14305 [Rhizobiales bacterium]|nr:hypothetical protein [Hyphomicrobiales bacterium]